MNPLLVKDINYEILKNLHPYFALEYCLSHRSANQCNERKYEILQTWVYPSNSVSELIKMFPNLNFSDVIELSLYYNPIPESIDYYDRYSLFYQSLVRGQSNAIRYIINGKKLFTFKNFHYLYGILCLCYRFERRDILNELSSYSPHKEFSDGIKTIISALDIKSGIKVNKPIFSLTDLSIFDFTTMSELFTAYELLEIIIIFGGLLGVGDITYDYEYLITGINSLIDNLDEAYVTRLVSKLVNIVGVDETLHLLNSYVPANLAIHQDNNFNIVLKDYPGHFDNNDLRSLDNRKHRKLFASTLDEWNKGLFYLTSGGIDSYIQWKGLGYYLPDKVDYETMQNSIGVNVLGLQTIGLQLIGLQWTDKNSHSYEFGEYRYEYSKIIVNLNDISTYPIFILD